MSEGLCLSNPDSCPSSQLLVLLSRTTPSTYGLTTSMASIYLNNSDGLRVLGLSSDTFLEVSKDPEMLILIFFGSFKTLFLLNILLAQMQGKERNRYPVRVMEWQMSTQEMREEMGWESRAGPDGRNWVWMYPKLVIWNFQKVNKNIEMKMKRTSRPGRGGAHL